jgi:hypothetical protein
MLCNIFDCCFAFALTIPGHRLASQTPMNWPLLCQVCAANRERARVADARTLVFEVATPSSTQLIVSTLTAEGGGGGGEDREASVGE